MKYCGINCCLRLGLSISHAKLTLTIKDCGRGIPQDFLSNHLFVPFSQVNHIEAGTGLGLPLVKRALDALGGTIDVQSVENLGTEIEVAIPLSSLTRGTNATDMQADSRLHLEHTQLPLQAQLFVPPIWSSGIYGKRGDRLVNNLLTSLSRSLQGLLPTEIRKWEPQGPAPSVIFVHYGDIEAFLNICDKTWTSVRVVVIGGAAQSDGPPVQLTNRFDVGPKPTVEITGPLLPSRIRGALEKVFDASTSPTGLANETANLTIAAEITPFDSKNDLKSKPEKHFNSTAKTTTSSPQGDAHMTIPSSSSSKGSSSISSPQNQPQRRPNEPRLLLVDDNAVNLRLLHKFLQKCGIEDVFLASGGSEAINMYDKAVHEGRRFDICFMDLSMPEVDGFRATAEIRQREAKNNLPESHRLEIVAFTGLVSSKDQRAAMAAGVDGYVTKPASIKSVQNVISKWKNLPSPPGTAP